MMLYNESEASGLKYWNMMTISEKLRDHEVMILLRTRLVLFCVCGMSCFVTKQKVSA